MDEQVAHDTPTPEVVDQVEATSVEAPPSEGTSANPEQASTEAELFSEKFDPESLPTELQSRYRQMQADYTRKTQEAAEQRKEAEAALALVSALQDDSQRESAIKYLAESVGEDTILSILGYDVEDDDVTGPELDLEDTDPEFRDPRVDELLAEREAERQRVAEEQRFQQVQSHYEQSFKSIEEKASRSLSDAEKELVIAKSLAGDPGPNGLPNVTSAWEALEAAWGERQKQWIGSKEAVKPTQGVTGELDPSTIKDPIKRRELRQKRMADMIRGR